MESSLLSVHENGGFIVDGAKVQNDVIGAGPSGRHVEARLVPAPVSVLTRDTCLKLAKLPPDVLALLT